MTDDTVTGYDRRDKALRNKLLDMNFAHYDGMSRPANDAYREGWDRVFGKKQERPDTENVVTAGPRCRCERECPDAAGHFPDCEFRYGGDTDAG